MFSPVFHGPSLALLSSSSRRVLPAALRRGVECLACALSARGRFVPRVFAPPDVGGPDVFEARFVAAPVQAEDVELVLELAQALVAAEGERISMAEARVWVMDLLDAWIDDFVGETLALGAVRSRRVCLVSSFQNAPLRRAARPISKELRLVFALLGEDRELAVYSLEERVWALSLCSWSSGLCSMEDEPVRVLESPPGWGRCESFRAWLLPAYEAVSAAALLRLSAGPLAVGVAR